MVVFFEKKKMGGFFFNKNSNLDRLTESESTEKEEYQSMAFFSAPKQTKSSLNEYEHTDSLSLGGLIKETVSNNCNSGNARAVGVFLLGALFIYFVSHRFGLDDENEMNRKLRGLNA